MIISGGVNIYPQEAENVLINHPKVLDVGVIGVPDAEMGEAVKAVVQPVRWDDAGPELEAELIEYCRAAPRRVQVPALGRLRPRSCPASTPASSTSSSSAPATGRIDSFDLSNQYI